MKINWNNANKCGLFTDKDVQELDRMHNKSLDLVRTPIHEPVKTKAPYRLYNAPRHVILDALHKIALRRKRSRIGHLNRF